MREPTLEQFLSRVRAVPVQQLKAPPKPGRNAPCPCRSGLKYKRCCGK